MKGPEPGGTELALAKKVMVGRELARRQRSSSTQRDATRLVMRPTGMGLAGSRASRRRSPKRKSAPMDIRAAYAPKRTTCAWIVFERGWGRSWLHELNSCSTFQRTR